MSYIRGTHRIAIAGGAREGREIAVGQNRLRQHTPRRREKFGGFGVSRGDLRSVLLDSVPSPFKAQNADRGRN